MRAARRSLTADEVEEKSAKIQTLLFSYEKYKSAETVMLYLSSFKEPSTEEIVRGALKSGKRVIVPVSDTKTETITLSYIDSFDELKKGAYGILEPKLIKSAFAEDIEFILIPGIAFDRRGHRIGFGKGYYDKLLHGLNAEKTALCYEFQLFNEIPSDAHDEPVNTIITEERIYAV